MNILIIINITITITIQISNLRCPDEMFSNHNNAWKLSDYFLFIPYLCHVMLISSLTVLGTLNYGGCGCGD